MYVFSSNLFRLRDFVLNVIIYVTAVVDVKKEALYTSKTMYD